MRREKDATNLLVLLEINELEGVGPSNFDESIEDTSSRSGDSWNVDATRMSGEGSGGDGRGKQDVVDNLQEPIEEKVISLWANEANEESTVNSQS